MDLSEFLLARIAEDEDGRARYLRDFAEALRARRFTVADYLDEESARVLAECDAKRRIVEEYAKAVERQERNSEKHARASARLDREAIPNLRSHGWTLSGQVMALEYAMRLLALPYADHEQFQEEWRP